MPFQLDPPTASSNFYPQLELPLDFSSIKDERLSTLKVSDLTNSIDDASDQIKGNLKNVPVIFEIAGSTLLAKDIKGQSAEKVEQAASEGNIGTLDTSTEGAPGLKLPAHKVREMEALGITSIELHSPSGVRTFKSFKIEALSDKELDLLITHVKTYIVFLKAQADPEDKKAWKAIARQELKLSGFVLERAIRKNHPQLQEIIKLYLDESNYTKEMILMKMWAEQKAIRERWQQEIQENYWENKHVEWLKQESRQNNIQKIAKQIFLKQEASDSDKFDKEAESLKSPLNVTNVGRLISLYTKLNKTA